MKEFVWAAVYFCGGAVVSLGLYALIAGGAKKEREYDIYREGFAEGHRIGLRKGKVLKIDAALYEELKARASGRVDVAPGQKIISKALVDEIVYGGPRRGGMMCELEGMRFKSAKIVGKDEEPRILSRDRVDVAPGFDSVREGKHAPSD